MLKTLLNLRNKINPGLVGLNLLFLVLSGLLILSLGGEGNTPTLSPDATLSPDVSLERLRPGSQFWARQANLMADQAYQQPIFHADRHPAKKIVQAPVQVVIRKPDVELTGVLKMSATQGWAFFKNKASGETTQLKLEESIEGWTLKSITETSAVLTNGGQETTIYIAGLEGRRAAAEAGTQVSQQQKPRTRKKR